MDIIKAPKQNEKAFGLMSEEMQVAIMKLDPTDREVLVEVEIGVLWSSCWKEGYCDRIPPYLSVRVRPDYEEKPEIVECEIREQDLRLQFTFGKHVGCLDEAPCFPDFIGFKYEGGMVRTDSIAYVPDGNYAGINHKMGLDGIESGQVEVVRATHVLFKGGK